MAFEVARRVGNEFTHGVHVVSLASVADAGLVIPTIAHALGLIERGERASGEMLRAALRDQHLMLVLDNVEHVVDAARNALGAEGFQAAWHDGEQLAVDQAITEALAFNPVGNTIRQPAGTQTHCLTAREVELLGLLATGMTNA